MGVVGESREADPRSRFVETGGAVTLSVLLFLPFFYYPIATVIWLAAPDLAGVYKQLLAGGAAALTVSFLMLTVLRSRRNILQGLSWPQTVRAPETWGFAFLVWITVVTASQPQPSSVQNLLVYLVFFAAVLLAQFFAETFVPMLRIFVWSFVGLLLGLGLVNATNGFLLSSIGAQLGGPRLYASYAVLGVVAIFAIPMTTWLRIVIGFGLLAGAVASSSRSSMTTLLVVLVIGVIITAPSFWRRFALIVPAGILILIGVLQLPWIRAHMEVSSITTPGMPFDDSGRGIGWTAVLESWFLAPFFGQGAGSSQSVTRQLESPLDHPHSEYLRILHDSGLAGFLLFGAFVVLALLWLWPRANGRPRGESVIAGFLLLVAGLVLGTIENYLVFPSLMWPAAVFLGLGLAAGRRDYQSPLDPRRKVRAASSENTELPQT